VRRILDTGIIEPCGGASTARGSFFNDEHRAAVHKMETYMPETDQIRWADLLTEYKYRPAELLSRVDSSGHVKSAVKASLIAAVQTCIDWPTELCDWRVVLIALLEMEVGSIYSRDLRTASHDQLLSKARDWGVTRTALRMTSLEIDSVYQRVKDELVRVSEDRSSRSGTGE